MNSATYSRQPAPIDASTKKKRKKREPKLDADGNVVKRPKTGYNLFVDKAYADLKEAGTVPAGKGEVFTKIGTMWKALDEGGKKVWNDKAKAKAATGVLGQLEPTTPGSTLEVEVEIETPEPLTEKKKKKKKKDKKRKLSMSSDA